MTHEHAKAFLSSQFKKNLLQARSLTLTYQTSLGTQSNVFHFQEQIQKHKGKAHTSCVREETRPCDILTSPLILPFLLPVDRTWLPDEQRNKAALREGMRLADVQRNASPGHFKRTGRGINETYFVKGESLRRLSPDDVYELNAYKHWEQHTTNSLEEPFLNEKLVKNV